MRVYAGIGSRRLNVDQRSLCRKVGRYLACKGWVLQTGACTGADQAFAEGAAAGGGEIRLYLPWASYEAVWVTQFSPVATVCVLDQHPDYSAALASVQQHHPNPGALTRGGVALHARNFLILKDCQLVVAFPLGGGGTTQGLRLAKCNGIPVLNMDNMFEESVRDHLQKVQNAT